MWPPVDVAVIGTGPGGYAAAFQAADLGLRTSAGADICGAPCAQPQCSRSGSVSFPWLWSYRLPHAQAVAS
uniref:hypothetical protein n=1 Tax=Nitrospira cf. moscoviensis SBR1015 TaxID=96242 RepID=UPI00117DE1A7|nr:hypothetical protein [Nitrospira cf. moscoviensis SBR1015]